jgi:FkbM family methyltransferase
MPPLREILRWLFQPGKERRALRHILERGTDGEYLRMRFRQYPDATFYYPRRFRWIDLCQTIDECFNPRNWHHFFSEHIRLNGNDVVIDCGAAEGLFTFVAAARARKVYAIEPVPGFVESLEKNFLGDPRVTVLPFAARRRAGEARMLEDEIFSRVTEGGSLPVAMKTLDDLMAQETDRITLIKSDVEGFEFPILLGAERLIRRDPPGYRWPSTTGRTALKRSEDSFRDCTPTTCLRTGGWPRTAIRS